MTSRLMAAMLVIGALIGACSSVEDGGDMTTVPTRPEPSEAPTGPLVRTLVIGETTFALHDEGEGCLAVAISQPGLQATVERRCLYPLQVLTTTSDCGWLESPPATTIYGACDLPLPVVFYGRVVEPNVSYVCIGTITPTSTGVAVESARFVDMDATGYILDAVQPNEEPVPHLFTRGGLRHGMEPLDAPSDPIYRFCEEQHPWGATEYSVPLQVFFALGDALRTDDVVILIDAGTGIMGMSGLAGGPEGIVDLPTRLPASSPGLAVRIEAAGAEPVEYFLPWPEAVRAVLEAGEPCRGALQVRLTLADTALLGAPDAAVLTLSQNLCGEWFSGSGTGTR